MPRIYQLATNNSPMKKYEKISRCPRLKYAIPSLISLIILNGCLSNSTEEQTTPNNKNSDHTAMLTAVSNNVIIPTYQTLVNQTKNWTEEGSVITNYCNAIGTDSEAITLSIAQQSWKEVMATWQQSEAFQIGPISDNSFNLRNRIYSWPEFVSSCTVDKNVVLAETSIDIDMASRQGRGLDALEYLLFNKNLNHTCPSQIIETQNWNSRIEQDRRTSRCNYANNVATDIANSAQVLLNTWIPEGEDYRKKLLDSGSDKGAFESQQAALNALSDTLFYLSNDVKDIKIAIPTGISNECSEISCPENSESFYSDNSLQNIKNNLLGFRYIFSGSPDKESTSYSFDDLLFTKNFPEISERILENTDTLINLIDNASDSFISNVSTIDSTEKETECTNAASNPDDTANALFTCQLHGKVKRITDELKGDFLTVISLILPSRVEGDND